MIERLGGVADYPDTSHFLEHADIKPGHILYEAKGAYHPGEAALYPGISRPQERAVKDK